MSMYNMNSPLVWLPFHTKNQSLMTPIALISLSIAKLVHYNVWCALMLSMNVHFHLHDTNSPSAFALLRIFTDEKMGGGCKCKCHASY